MMRFLYDVTTQIVSNLIVATAIWFTAKYWRGFLLPFRNLHVNHLKKDSLPEDGHRRPDHSGDNGGSDGVPELGFHDEHK